MRDPVLQSELDFDHNNMNPVVEKKVVDDGVIDSVFGNQLHGKELLADFEKQCKEFENG